MSGAGGIDGNLETRNTHRINELWLRTFFVYSGLLVAIKNDFVHRRRYSPPSRSMRECRFSSAPHYDLGTSLAGNRLQLLTADVKIERWSTNHGRPSKRDLSTTLLPLR